MSGIRLEELDSSEMLDVIHYIFEEDMKVSSKEEMDAITEVRRVIYTEFYEKDYQYGAKASRNTTYSASGKPLDNSFDDIVPFDPNVKNRRKGYIPPTKLDEKSSKPFGDTLDSPLN